MRGKHKRQLRGSSKQTPMMENDTIQTFKDAPALEQALVRKLDMRVLPTMFLILIMNYVDVRSIPSPLTLPLPFRET